MTDRIANHILKRVWYELAGVYAPGSLRESASIVFDTRSLVITHPDGTVVELTARTLAADDPASIRIAEWIAAIDAGEVE